MHKQTVYESWGFFVLFCFLFVRLLTWSVGYLLACLFISLVGCLVGQSIGWLINLLVGWSVAVRLFGWLVGWLHVCLIGQSISWSIIMLVGWLLGRLVGQLPLVCLAGWLVTCLVDWLVSWLVGWLLTLLVGWSVGRHLVGYLVGCFKKAVKKFQNRCGFSGYNKKVVRVHHPNRMVNVNRMEKKEQVEMPCLDERGQRRMARFVQAHRKAIVAQINHQPFRQYSLWATKLLLFHPFSQEQESKTTVGTGSAKLDSWERKK